MAKRLSSFVNLQDYLDLNREKGAEMGANVVDLVGGQAGKAGGAINSAQRRFNVGAEAGTLGGPDANAWNQGSNMYTADQAAKKSAEGYTGPKSLSDVDENLYGQVADAVGKVKAAQSQDERGGVIAEAYKGQSASGAGGSALDSFLTGATSSAELSGLGTKYGGLMDTLGIAEGKAQDTAAGAEKKSAANAAQWAKLQPQLEEEARRQLEAKIAGDRAHAQQLYDIDEQQAEQYGGGTSWGGHETHAIDPREQAAMEGRLSEYDRAHPSQEYTGAYNPAKPPAMNEYQRKKQLDYYEKQNKRFGLVNN